MIYRITIALALTVCLLVLPGCLDDEAKSKVQSMQTWTEARLNEPGDLIVVRRSDLEQNRDSLTALLTQTEADWSGLEALLALLGVSSAGGVVAWLRRFMQWRTVAIETIEGVEKAKVRQADGTYTIDKTKLRLSMSSATAKVVEKMRRETTERLIREQQAAQLRLAAVRRDDPAESRGGANGPGPTTATGG